jgi:hypothetical protein
VPPSNEASNGKTGERKENIHFAWHLNSRLCFPAYNGVKASQLLGHWPFLGSYYDVSTNARELGTIQGNNVQLAFEQYAGYVQIRKLGFLNIDEGMSSWLWLCAYYVAVAVTVA